MATFKAQCAHLDEQGTQISRCREGDLVDAGHGLRPRGGASVTGHAPLPGAGPSSNHR